MVPLTSSKNLLPPKQQHKNGIIRISMYFYIHGIVCYSKNRSVRNTQTNIVNMIFQLECTY